VAEGRVIAAPWPRPEPLDERLLVVDPARATWRDSRVGDLTQWLRPNDVLIVNDAATLPASLAASTSARVPIEIRLAAHVRDSTWRAVLFGPGDWRTRTEDRAPPPVLTAGDVLRITADLDATVEDVDARSPRLVTLRFSARGSALWAALYQVGHPIQYAHVRAPLELWHAQTVFASRPWAVEMPSAARPFTWTLVGKLRARGVRVHRLTHAAGLSSTGDPGLDARLPLPEVFDIPRSTVEAVRDARDAQARVVAVGTTVVRALEGCAAQHGGELVAGEGVTDLLLGEGSRRLVVDGIVTGLHDLGSSHRSLLHAFAPEALLARAWEHAHVQGYLGHEFGDVCLVLAARLGRFYGPPSHIGPWKAPQQS
jgi:S-adenosylmethionine:tRNA ribosyltransferase-isomerase